MTKAPKPTGMERFQGQAPSKLAEVVYVRILKRIEARHYPIGGRLPSEQDLAASLGVSRPVLRDALAWLREDGVIVSRQGSGTYVCRIPEPSTGARHLMSLAETRRCLEFRLGLESEAAYLAARDATADGIASIHRALDRLERSLRLNEIAVEEDFDLHLAIAEASENPYFSRVLSDLRDNITEGMTISRNSALLDAEARLRALHGDHLTIVEAISAREPERARVAMRAHIAGVLEAALGGITERLPPSGQAHREAGIE